MKLISLPEDEKATQDVLKTLEETLEIVRAGNHTGIAIALSKKRETTVITSWHEYGMKDLYYALACLLRRMEDAE